MDNKERIHVGDRVSMVRRGKRRVWTAEYFFNGQHRRQSLKTANTKIATERARKIEVQLADGTFEQRPSPKTIDEAATEYVAFLKTEGRARKTLVKYEGILKIVADFLLKQHVNHLHQVTLRHFDCFRAERAKKRRIKTLYTEGVVVKQFFRWCRTRKWISENPLDNYRLKKPVLEPKPGPTLEQIHTILKQTDDRLQPMLAVLAFTGMRSGELQRLRVEDVDLESGWVHVRSREGEETKTRTSRKVPIHPILMPYLGSVSKRKRTWFFTSGPSQRRPTDNNPINTKDLNEDFLALLRQLELPAGRDAGFTIHSLRHSFETICINALVPARVVDRWTGHSSRDRSVGNIHYYSLDDKASNEFMNKVPFGDGEPAANADEDTNGE